MLKNNELVLKLIELRERVINIYLHSMKKDMSIDLAIKMAFDKVVNFN